MTIQQIIEAKDNPPKTAKQLKRLLEGTHFNFIKSSFRSEPHIIASRYQLDEFGQPTIYEAPTISNAYSQLLQSAIAINKSNICSIENLYNALQNLDFESFCKALRINPHDQLSKCVLADIQQLDRALRLFYRKELEAIAIYYHHQKKNKFQLKN